jgi:hypothetical protein
LASETRARDERMSREERPRGTRMSPSWAHLGLIHAALGFGTIKQNQPLVSCIGSSWAHHWLILGSFSRTIWGWRP